MEDTAGNVAVGFVHGATNFGKNDLFCTNGFLLVNERPNTAGGEPATYFTRLSLASGKGLVRGEVVDWLSPRGRPREYLAPAEIRWRDDTRVCFMRDITHGCGRLASRASRATTIDSTGDETVCTYTYELRDWYELLDHVPFLAVIPDSFRCGRFYGGDTRRMPIAELRAFHFVFEPDRHPELKKMVDDWLGGMTEEERADATRRGFRIEKSHEMFTQHLSGITKPDYLSE